VGPGMFLSCTSMNGITIPNSVTNIGDYAFAGTILAKVILPVNLINIGQYAFAGTVLTNVALPVNLASIGAGAFSQTRVASFTIPGGVTNIGVNAFSLCARLTNITVAATNSYYSSLNGVLFDLSQATLLAYPDALGGAYALPGSVDDIAEGAFAGCSLASVTIDSGVTNIGESAFYDSGNLAALYFEGNAPVTDPTAFDGDANAIIYYLPGATGWSSPFAGLTAVLAEVVTWANPASILYGAPLTTNQLDAVADVPGSFTYTPTNGSVLAAGAYTLSVVFTPSNTVYYGNVTNTASLVVLPAPLTITASNASKTYGATLTFAGTEFAVSGLVNGDTVTSVTLTSAGAAATAAVNGSAYAIMPSAAQPASLTNNYLITYQNGQLTINPAGAAIVSGLTANNKVYDGTTSATLSSNNVVFSGIVNGDTVSLNTNGYAANFASDGVGSGLAVAVSGLTLTGASATNYTLAQPTNLSANITAAPATIVSGLTANNKVYDGTTTATLNSNNVALSGVFAGDTVNLDTNGYVANFASANVGNGIAVTVSGLTLSGANATNYALTQPTGLTANITSATPPSLQISASKPNIIISWSTNATTYVLNKTASLARPVTWTPVTNSITVNGTNNTVTVNASSGVQFFELMKAP
jgi:hypothetical protein